MNDNMDVFAEKFEGIDLHGKKIIKAEFDNGSVSHALTRKSVIMTESCH